MPPTDSGRGAGAEPPAEGRPHPSGVPVYPDLAGKVAVVTGGSRGIGAETGRALAAQGVAVCLVGRDRPALFAVAEEIGKRGGTAIGAVADVTDAGALRRVADRVAAELGPVDVLAAFAGGQGSPTPTPDLTEERWHQVLDAELTSAFLTVHAFLPGMVERFSGSILTLSSSAGRQPGQANLAYGVAHAGLTMLTRQLATELGPQGIRVNCLAPTAVRTEKTAATMPKETQHKLALRHPLRRMGEPGDIASTALFLASDAAGYLTGLTIDVAGGRITN
ncbi:SDR family oxidoreductase [Streptomyces tubbatahanensis]|uniref:SDR family oxidoreductase n=1 Tax=Streptomyces tubbatahanensis TaxID=2923272 RepID=A0ABY3XRR7_9ACTN|nr:SDR family NAD(P)-dependent oxidoreductase [Streptomyces tubbatahanensis]UNS97114.1 SDR family oxidoreductase [Streptomyces tubbatahanensis]